MVYKKKTASRLQDGSHKTTVATRSKSKGNSDAAAPKVKDVQSPPAHTQLCTKTVRIAFTGSMKRKQIQARKDMRTVREDLKQTNRLRRAANFSVSQVSFQKEVGAAVRNLGSSEYKWKRLAILALQEASEMYLSGLLKYCNLFASNCHHDALYPVHMNRALQLRGENNKSDSP